MTPLFTIVERELVRFYRQPSRVIGALLTPLLFWLFIGAGVGNSFNTGGPGASPGSGNFLQYFFPGTLVLIVFFTAIFSTISVIEDRREGFLQSVLVAPVSRLTIAGGKIVGGALLALFQAVIFLAFAPVAGFALNPATIGGTLLALALVAAGLTGLGFLIAWSMDSTQGFHAIMNVFLIPLWLLSGSAFPVGGAHGWLRFLMKLNPMTYGVTLVRRALYGGAPHDWSGEPSAGLCLAVTIGFSLAMVILSGWMARRRILTAV